MTSLRDALWQFNANAKIGRPIEPLHLREARQAVDEMFGATTMKPPDADRLQSTYKKLQAVARGHKFNQLTNSDLRRAPWLIFQAIAPAERPLAENVDFTKGYLRELIERISAGAPASAVVALIFCILLFYPSQLRIFHPLRRVLQQHLLPKAKGSKIDKWRPCLSDCGLLEEDAPVRLAKRLSDSQQSPSAVLDACCLRGLLANGALAERAFLTWVQEVQRQLTGGTATDVQIARLLDFSLDPDSRQGLRYEGARVVLANGLLLPFAEGRPGQQAAEMIKEFLLT